MTSSVTVQSYNSTDSYTDFASVNAIRSLDDKNQALEKIAQQFESIMMRMMMKSMRSANQVFAEGNFLSSHASDTYREMLDDQLALSLSQGKGMGIAEVMVRQLTERFGSSDKSNSKNIEDITDYLAYRNNTVSPIPAGRIFKHSIVPKEVSQSIAPSEFDGSVRQFVERLYSMAEQSAEQLGIDPAVLIAQSALETGWGAKVSGKRNGDSSFNFFNIKADKRWSGDSVMVTTMEIRDGLAVKERAAFRAYPSPAHSFNDYVDFIRTNMRYEQALHSENSASYIRNLSAAGYATDPDYADKILRILNSETLQNEIKRVASRKQLAAIAN